MSNSLTRYEKIESRRKVKQNSHIITSNATTNINNIRTNNTNLPFTNTNDNLSFSDIQINKHFVNYTKHPNKNDNSFRNEVKTIKSSQKTIIETSNSVPNTAQKPNTYGDSYRTITNSNSPHKNDKANISNIRKAFLNLNKKNSYNITPIKRRGKSPQILNIKEKIFKCPSIQQKKDFHSNNSSCNRKNERIIISTLPRAIIDISKTETISHGLNITYNMDELINFYLKLKSKTTKLDNKMINELKLLRDAIDEFILKYNSPD